MCVIYQIGLKAFQENMQAMVGFNNGVIQALDSLLGKYLIWKQQDQYPHDATNIRPT